LEYNLYIQLGTWDAAKAKARRTPPIYFIFLLSKMPTLQSAALAAVSWQCQ
jgi:hypothetical protein